MRPEAYIARAFLVLAMLGLGACTGQQTRGDDKGSGEESAASINLRLGQGYLQQGRLELAQDRIHRALAQEPRNPDAHTLMAVLQEQIGNGSKAGEHYLKAVELAPEKGVFLHNYGRWLCRVERFEEAESHFERALADPFYDTPVLALLNSAICARASGDDARAEQRFRSVLQRQSNHPEALYQMASLHFARGEFLRARAFLQRLEALAPLAAEGLLLGHRIESNMGDSDAALNYRRLLLERYPDSEQARHLEPSS